MSTYNTSPSHLPRSDLASDLNPCCTLNPDKGIANTVHQESVGYTGFLVHFENKTQMLLTRGASAPLNPPVGEFW